MEVDATIQHERAVKFDFHTDADDARAHGAEERQVAPAAVDGVQVVRHRVAVEEVLRAAGGGAGRGRGAAGFGVRVVIGFCAASEGSVRAHGLSRRALRSATRARRRCRTLAADSSSGSGLMLMIDGARATGRKR